MRGLQRVWPDGMSRIPRISRMSHEHDAEGRRAAVAGEAAAAAAHVMTVTPEPDPTAAAFFDVDNTIMRGASIYYFARGLAARKMFGARDLARFAWGQVALRISGENTDHITPRVRRRSRS